MYRPSDGIWQVSVNARGIQELRAQFGEELYNSNKKSLQIFLCEYFNTGNCMNKLGKSISPMGATKKGGKILKVRWGIPGRGKSGSLRLCVVAYCNEKRVFGVAAHIRSEDPPDSVFTEIQEPLQ